MHDYEGRDAKRRAEEASHLEQLASWAASQVEEVNAAASRIDALEAVAIRAATEAADRATRHNLPNVLNRVGKGGFNVTSTCEFSDEMCQGKGPLFENPTRDDLSSKNESKRVRTDRDTSLKR